MLIKITEETGIKHEGLGHMKKGEIREVPDNLAQFFIANGWAEANDGSVKPGKRGSSDFQNPDEHGKEEKTAKPTLKGAPAPKAATKGTVQPKDLKAKTQS